MIPVSTWYCCIVKLICRASIGDLLYFIRPYYKSKDGASGNIIFGLFDNEL